MRRQPRSVVSRGIVIAPKLQAMQCQWDWVLRDLVGPGRRLNTSGLKRGEGVRTNWLRLIERSGDANLGQALVRLAKLAESVHQYDAAQRLHTERFEEGQCRVEGFDRRTAGSIARTEAGAVCTEADR